VRVERAEDCDGVKCGTAITVDGKPVPMVRHDRHLVVTGHNPPASPLYFVIPR
jgi:hypothetical protein